MGAEIRTDDDRLLGALLADRYLVLELLGEGGMARVYAARHLGLDKRVAIKVHAPKMGVPRAAARFLREARTMAEIDHPNVVRVTDFGETSDGQLYLVMEYLEGEDLAGTLANVGRMSWARVKHIVLQVARGLARAHANGIVHRDIKPENILRVPTDGDPDFVKVIDFGIARAAADVGGKLTQTGALCGTPLYMAPELSRTTKVDQRADIYALGIVAYELLTGTVPFDGDDFMEVLYRHATEPLVPPSEVLEGLDAAADAFVRRACAKDPSERFQTMQELIEHVEGNRGAPERVPQRSRALVPALVGATAGVVAAVIAIVAFAVGPDAAEVAEPIVQASEPVAAPRVAAPTVEAAAPDEAVAPDDPAEPTAARDPIEPAAASPSEPAPEVTSSSTSTSREGSLRARAKALRAVQPAVSACVGAITGGKSNDRVQVRFVVASNGDVQSARAVGQHARTPLGSCVVAAAKDASFPAENGKSSFTHAFRL